MHGWEPALPLLSALVPAAPRNTDVHEYVPNLELTIHSAWDSAALQLF